MTSELLTTDTVASVLKISKRRAYQLMAEGRLEHYRMDGGRDIRISTEQLDAYLASHKVPTRTNGYRRTSKERLA
jgi:excisionase family DNA binding protein